LWVIKKKHYSSRVREFFTDIETNSQLWSNKLKTTTNRNGWRVRIAFFLEASVVCAGLPMFI